MPWFYREYSEVAGHNYSVYSNLIANYSLVSYGASCKASKTPKLTQPRQDLTQLRRSILFAASSPQAKAPLSHQHSGIRCQPLRKGSFWLRLPIKSHLKSATIRHLTTTLMPNWHQSRSQFMLKQQSNHRLIGSWEILPNAKAPLSNRLWENHEA